MAVSAAIWVLVEMLLRRPSSVAVFRRWFFMQQPVEQWGREASADEQGRNAVAQDITRAGLSRKDGAPSVQPGEPAERSQRLVLTDLDSDGCPGPAGRGSPSGPVSSKSYTYDPTI